MRAAVSAPSSGDNNAGGVGPEAQGRRLEILVHNVSHKDMVLSLRRTRRAAANTRQQQQEHQQEHQGRLAGEAISNVINAVSFVQ